MAHYRTPQGFFSKMSFGSKVTEPRRANLEFELFASFPFPFKNISNKINFSISSPKQNINIFLNLSLQKIAKSLSRNLRIKTKYLTSLLAGVCCVHRRLEATSSYQQLSYIRQSFNLLFECDLPYQSTISQEQLKNDFQYHKLAYLA